MAAMCCVVPQVEMAGSYEVVVIYTAKSQGTFKLSVGSFDRIKAGAAPSLTAQLPALVSTTFTAVLCFKHTCRCILPHRQCCHCTPDGFPCTAIHAHAAQPHVHGVSYLMQFAHFCPRDLAHKQFGSITAPADYSAACWRLTYYLCLPCAA